MRASATGSLPLASSSMRSTRRRSAPGLQTSTPPGRTSWGRSAGRSWRRRLENWGSARGPRSPHGATARGRVMRGKRCRHRRPRISRSLSSGRPKAGPVGSIRATTLALFCAFVLRSAAAAEADCRELDRNYTIAKPSITSVQLNATLFASAAKDCGALARRLIADGASLQARDRAGAMPLAHAARGGHAALVARLLAEGAAIDARDLNGATALYAAAEAERPATVAALLAKGADPNLAGLCCVSTFAAAAFRGNDRIVELLLSRGADADHVDATGRTALMIAAERGDAAVVETLVMRGADRALRDAAGKTACDLAASGSVREKLTPSLPSPACGGG